MSHTSEFYIDIPGTTQREGPFLPGKFYVIDVVTDRVQAGPFDSRYVAEQWRRSVNIAEDLFTWKARPQSLARNARRSARGVAGVTEEQHDEAMRVLRAEYYQSVRTIAQEILASNPDEDDIEDLVIQALESSHWVIYTHANLQVLFVSDNADAYWEDYGDAESVCTKHGIEWQVLAGSAMHHDIREQIDAERA